MKELSKGTPYRKKCNLQLDIPIANLVKDNC